MNTVSFMVRIGKNKMQKPAFFVMTNYDKSKEIIDKDTGFVLNGNECCESERRFMSYKRATAYYNQLREQGYKAV